MLGPRHLSDCKVVVNDEPVMADRINDRRMGNEPAVKVEEAPGHQETGMGTRGVLDPKVVPLQD